MKTYLSIMAILGWFALIAQYYLHISLGITPPGEATIRFFSYFTILTNIMVALCCTMTLLRPGTFFSKPATFTALTVYIVIVGIIYNLILRFTWQPQGLQRIVDELLHLVIPLLFFVYWLLFVPKDTLKWNSLLPWLIYPLVYIVYVFIRGSFSGFYPYPFLDVSAIGISKALINSIGIAALFIGMSLFFIAWGKWRSRKAID
ncbi:hypothetical protein GFS24_12950 [Chitinophaga sp. SYP-B3965]|uniref:Pr6Pr family membrane protein n=1 Tax=Chitinophaga sp. SYP-B3965 TaxID=2663120 RepID=UPI001299EF63|nr:Pr6Pr family membrane protein [Chitinophaga sp. SYP-B3965]MRG46029.1 hypothetical protein [Chitinophaga sp. SYP-B3965]